MHAIIIYKIRFDMLADVLQIEDGNHGDGDEDLMTILDREWNMNCCNLQEEIGNPVSLKSH